jgi:serine/threonine protein kinase
MFARSQVAFALQKVHSCGLAHCDIKPENIMMLEDSSIKLCDFGSAVAIDPSTGRVAAMPSEITDLEDQFASDVDHANSKPSLADLTPYSLRKVTQVSAPTPKHLQLVIIQYSITELFQKRLHECRVGSGFGGTWWAAAEQI